MICIVTLSHVDILFFQGSLNVNRGSGHFHLDHGDTDFAKLQYKSSNRAIQVGFFFFNFYEISTKLLILIYLAVLKTIL